MKVSYEIDPHNRLIIKRTGEKSRIARFRTCIEGTFKTYGNNSLLFQAKLTDDRSPEQIKFTGKWSLDKNHNLVFSLNKWGDQIAGNKLTFQSELINISGDELAFSLVSKQGKSAYSIYILKLSGILNVDNQNRLGFSVTRDEESDTLKFSASWQVENNLLVYTYERNSPKLGKKDTCSLTISGFWEIKEKYRLSYRLDKGSGPELEFRTSLGKLLRDGNRSGLQYEAGIGMAKGKRFEKIMIFGKWMIKNGVGIILEVAYGDGLKYPISFNAKVELPDGYTFSVELRNTENENLGIKLELSRKIMQAGEGFVRLLGNGREKAIEIGAGFSW